MKINYFDVSQLVVVITGGTGVLGGSIAQHMLESGAKVVVLGVREENLHQKVEQLKHFGEVTGFVCNVLDTDRLKQVREEIIAQFGKMDVLINVAGGNIPAATVSDDKTIFDLKFEDLNKVTDLNLNGTIYPSLIFGEAIANQGKGSILNISSMATYSAMTRIPGYSVAKTGVNIFTQWLATELALKFGDKLRVNAIAPGFFVGDQNKAFLLNEDGTYTERSKKIIAKTPMRRFGDIAELNGLVQFLCSDAASFVTGTIIPVDGGFSAFSGV